MEATRRSRIGRSSLACESCTCATAAQQRAQNFGNHGTPYATNLACKSMKQESGVSDTSRAMIYVFRKNEMLYGGGVCEYNRDFMIRTASDGHVCARVQNGGNERN
jgi:hypothetical protein